MQINPSSILANQEISTNKAQTGLDILTRTQAKSEQSEPLKQERSESAGSEQSEAMRIDVAQMTGKGQNIDIKV